MPIQNPAPSFPMQTATPSHSVPRLGVGSGLSAGGVATLRPVPNVAMPVAIAGITLPPLHERWVSGQKCLFREIPIPVHSDWAFTQAWRKHKVAYFERGFSVRNVNGKWLLSQWLLLGPPVTLTPIGQERLESLLAPTTGKLDLQYQAPALVLPELPQWIADKLRGYQIEPARQLLRALINGPKEWGFAGAFDGSDMGTGKTYMAMAAALAMGKKIIVLCPTVGTGGWQRAFDHFGATPHAITTYEAVRGGWRSHIVQQVGDRFIWQLPKDIIIILDEGQYVRHDDSLTFQCCVGAIRQGIPIIIASATIAINPMEMRFMGRITGLHKGANDWDRFLAEHGCAKKGQTWKWDGKGHHLTRINSKLFPFRGCRVRKQDLGDDCPETIIEALPFDLPEGIKIEQQWREAKEMLERMKEQGKTAAAIASVERNVRMKIWQASENVLVPHLAQRIRQDVKEGNSVAVFMSFSKSRLALARLLNTNAGFYGGQPPARRKYWEDEFQANRQHILVSNIGAGGASVSLHDIHGERPRIAYIFPTDHVVKFEQATGRVDRVGGQSLSRQYIPHIKGSLTEEMIRSLRRKMANIARINDGTNAAGARF